MANPRDAEPELAVAVNPDTGRRITEAAKHHSAVIKAAALALYNAMHAAEGSSETNTEFQEKDLQRAADMISTGVLLALWDVRNRL